MQQNKVLVGVGIAVLAIAGGWIGGSFNGSTDTVTREVVRELQPMIEQAFGVVSVLNSPLEVEGTKTHILRQAFVQGTSTACRLLTPNATTTGFVSVKMITSPSYATGFQLAFANFQTGTTTNLDFISVGASASNAYLIATSTTFSPKIYINFKLSTSSGTTVASNFAPTGVCQGFLREI